MTSVPGGTCASVIAVILIALLSLGICYNLAHLLHAAPGDDSGAGAPAPAWRRPRLYHALGCGVAARQRGWRLSAYVINLDRRPGRWRRTRDNLKQAGLYSPCLDLRRVPAVDGEELLPLMGSPTAPGSARIVSEQGARDLAALAARGHRTHHHQLSPGAVGCFLSHVGVWRGLLRQQPSTAPYTLILEDDVYFRASPEGAPPLLDHVDDVVSHRLPRDWHILLLGQHARTRDLADRGTPVDGQAAIRRCRHFWGLFAYAISRRGCEAALQHFDQDEGGEVSCQLDAYLSWLCARGALRVYALKDSLVQSYAGVSDVQVDLIDAGSHAVGGDTHGRHMCSDGGVPGPYCFRGVAV